MLKLITAKINKINSLYNLMIGTAFVHEIYLVIHVSEFFF